MPRCETCNARFNGSGHHCTLHKSDFYRSHTKDHYKYNNGFSYPSDRHIRISYDTVGAVALRRPQQNPGHNDTQAISLYDYNNTSAISAPIVHALAQSFATLQDTHVIASLTYTVAPSGAHVLSAEANLEREQCPTCYVWFSNHEKLRYHQLENPVGCEAHGVCMRLEDALWHAMKERHERCFVRGCVSLYRREGEWRTWAVEDHVRKWHC